MVAKRKPAPKNAPKAPPRATLLEQDNDKLRAEFEDLTQKYTVLERDYIKLQNDYKQDHETGEQHIAEFQAQAKEREEMLANVHQTNLQLGDNINKLKGLLQPFIQSAKGEGVVTLENWDALKEL